MKSRSKMIPIAILLAAAATQGASAFFVTDVQAIMNDIMTELKNAEQRIKEAFQWEQEIKSMQDRWDQIQRYYEELEGLSADVLRNYSGIADDLARIGESLSSASAEQAEANRRMAGSAARAEESHRTLLEEADRLRDDEMDRVASTPVLGVGDRMKVIEASLKPLREANARRRSELEAMNKEIAELSEMNRSAARFLSDAQQSLAKARKKLEDEANRQIGIQESGASAKRTEKQLMESQILISSLNVKVESIEKLQSEYKDRTDETGEQLQGLIDARDAYSLDCEREAERERSLSDEYEKLARQHAEEKAK